MSNDLQKCDLQKHINPHIAIICLLPVSFTEENKNVCINDQNVLLRDGLFDNENSNT